MSSGPDTIETLQRDLTARGIDCVRERFRLPRTPRITPFAGFLACSAGAFSLSAGDGAAAFLLATAGLILLVLDDCGFAPLDWLGPKERRSVLVVRGTPGEPAKRAFFFGVPLRCRLTGTGYFSGREEIRRGVHAAGITLSVLLWAASAAVLMVFLSPVSHPATAAGVTLLLVPVLEVILSSPGEGPPNLAAGWVATLAGTGEGGRRPFVLVYAGDEGEVKYFLARHRGALFRGAGAFLEFSPGAQGPPAVAEREGPLLPYRVEERLLTRVLDAARDRGVPPPRTVTLRYRSPALLAMSRGFGAVTLFRTEAPAGDLSGFRAETAGDWARGIAPGGD